MEKTEAQAIAELAQKPFIDYIEGVPVIFTPDENGSWDAERCQQLLSAPTRKFGTIKIHSVDSFIDVVKSQGSLTNSNIYVDADYAANKVSATAVFNDFGDDPGATGWRDHRAVFIPRQTQEWKRWTAKSGAKMTQSELAFFLEENVNDIVTTTPGGVTGADVLAFVTKLEETKTVKFRSGTNIQNGEVQLEYVEDGDDNTKGKLNMFKEFSLGLRVFEGDEERIGLKAFLRYRINRNDAQVTFWFDLQRPDRVIEDASKAIVKKISDQAGVAVIYGEAS